jgi:germacradienol/geosmin synthase
MGLDAKAREKLHGYVEKLQQWMAGVLIWHQTVDRYKESELRQSRTPGRYMQHLRGPTGRGTSAARLASLFAGNRSASAGRETPRVHLTEGKR